MAIAKHPDTDALAAMLSRAFYDDPLFVYFFPDDTKREKLNHFTFRYMLNHAANKGQIVVTDDGLSGAAIWSPSGALHYSLLDLLRYGAVRGSLHQGPAAVLRQLKALDIMQAMHKSIITDPHYYLATIGVEPDKHGKGLGSALLRPTLAELDEQQLPVYLDTHNEDNVSLYRRFGFEIVHHGFLPGGSVMHWAMLRLPG
jgi:ribosomal protein S18 acetylase RimI-like enzyme